MLRMFHIIIRAGVGVVFDQGAVTAGPTVSVIIGSEGQRGHFEYRRGGPGNHSGGRSGGAFNVEFS